MPVNQHLIGVISDTHGLLRPEAAEALRGVELIIHAGDIGHPRVLTALKEIAPVQAVRGNTDRGAWAARLPWSRWLEVGGAGLLVLHDLKTLEQALGARPRFQAVIYGHSHQPRVDCRDGVLYLNPGSAGPRRFTLPVTLALLRVQEGRLQAEVVNLPGLENRE
ncbi:MAG: metallophosphoesterase family protein [Desulfobaccales bacterium]